MSDITISIPSVNRRDLEFTYNTDFWPHICKDTFLSTTSALPPGKMFKIDFKNTNICSHSTQNETDTYLDVWDCTPAKTLILSSNFWTAASHYHPHSSTLEDSSKKILSITVIIAKKAVLMNWKIKNSEYRALEKRIN